MKIVTLFVIGLVALCCALSVEASTETQPGEKADPLVVSSTRIDFNLPKIFDFNRFKQIFKKSYSSLLENLARKRIFLAKAFRVFISAIEYKYRRVSSYLAINQMSDWTPEELKRTRMKPEVFAGYFSDLPGRQPMLLDDETHEEEQIAVADLEDIAQKLKEIELNSQAPGFSEINRELLSSAQRKKRSITNDTESRDLSLDDLLLRVPKVSLELDDSVSSNNPNYQQPELTSFGSDEPVTKLSDEEASKIASLTSASYLSSVLQKTGFVSKKSQLVPDFKDQVYVDHRASGCLFQPRAQGHCGGCYSFATIALYEWHYCMATGKKVAFSEQYVIDCGKRVGRLWGCQGGVFRDVHKFVDKFGLELRRTYPYRQTNDSCPYLPDEPDEQLGYIRVKSKGFKDIKLKHAEKELEKSPLVLNIYTSDNFYDYGGGVDDPKKCSSDNGHSVLIVGSGREDGQEYWLLRNSHSFTWGEMGHYKLNKKSKCFMSEFAHKLRKFKVPKDGMQEDISVQVKSRYNKHIEAENKERELESLRARKKYLLSHIYY